MTSVAHHRYHTLDAMRGVAAISVLLYHWRPQLPWIPFGSGYLAVDLFFLLSGFIIAHAYDEKLAKGLGFLDFLALRLIRLCPMLAFGTAIGFALLAVQSLHGWKMDYSLLNLGVAAVLQIFVIPMPIGRADLLFRLNPPEWSLLFEILVNLIYCACFAWTRRWVLWAVVAVSAVALIWICLSRGSINAGTTFDEFPVGAMRVAFSFSLGVLIHRDRGLLTDRVGTVPSSVLLLLVGALLAVSVSGTLRAAFDIFFVLIASPLLVILGAKAVPQGRWLPFAVILAELSYPLYILHEPVREIGTLLLKLHGLARFSWFGPSVVACGCIAVTIVLSWAAGRFYDAPVRSVLQGFRRRKAARPAYGAPNG